MPSFTEASAEVVDVNHLMKPIKRKIHEISCAIWNGGHELYPAHETNRIFQKCVSCGHETKGWTIGIR